MAATTNSTATMSAASLDDDGDNVAPADKASQGANEGAQTRWVESLVQAALNACPKQLRQSTRGVATQAAKKALRTMLKDKNITDPTLDLDDIAPPHDYVSALIDELVPQLCPGQSTAVRRQVRKTMQEHGLDVGDDGEEKPRTNPARQAKRAAKRARRQRRQR